MGALRNPLPGAAGETKPPSAKSKKSKLEPAEPREWKELDRSVRSGTDYDKWSGFSPLYGAFLADLIRLTSGDACSKLLLLILQDLGRQITGKDMALPEESRELWIPELATLCGCDERSINRVFAYLKQRKMATVARRAGEKVVIGLHFKTWPEIKLNYKEWLATQIHDAEEDEQAGDPKQLELPIRHERVVVTKKPVTVKRGSQSRPTNFKCGVKAFRLAWEGKTLDLQYEAVVDSGEFVLSLAIPGEAQQSKGSGKSPSTESVSYRNPGHPCPENRTKSGRRTEDPRAEFLAALFDPPCLQWSRKSLSADEAMMSATVAELGNIPDSALRDAVTERAERKMEPRHCPAIVRQARLNWEKGKDLPARPRSFTGAELEAMVEEDKRKRIQRQKEILENRRKRA